MNERNYAPGLILIGLGILFAIVEVTDVGGEAVVAVIGGTFLVAYALKRTYGFLVAGGIMTGLGLGIVWETQAPESGAAVLLGLGGGFLAVYIIDLVVRGRAAMWWPVIPGGIVGTIGALLALEAEGALEQLDAVWPIGLVVVGALLLIAEVGRRTRSAPEP
jgi:hypothetical protein